MRASEKIELSLIESRQCAFVRAIDEPRAIPLTPQRVAQIKTRIFAFGVAFHFFGAGNRRHFKFRMWIEHSKTQSTDNKPSLKWAWSRHVTRFKFLVSQRYLWNGLR